MQRFTLVVLAACACLMSCRHENANETDADLKARLIALERGALDRWGKGDVNGYLEIYAGDVSYFDPGTTKRIYGKDAATRYFAPFAGKIGISHYEMIDPMMQRSGDVAILSYNLVDDVTLTPQGLVKLQTRWNCTQVYKRYAREWKIVHNHWSFTKPELKGM
jgi:ketosteroid isomerase-like protein